MKRSKRSSRAMRHQRNAVKGITKGNSPYAQKVARGNQMYGPGCCAHELTPQKMAEIRRRVAERERFDSQQEAA